MDKKHQYQFVGACILIALGVIFVPMLLDGDIEYDQDLSIKQIPVPPQIQVTEPQDTTGFVPLEPVQAFDAATTNVVEEIDAANDAPDTAELEEPVPLPSDNIVPENTKENVVEEADAQEVAEAKSDPQLADEATPDSIEATADDFVVPVSQHVSSANPDLSTWVVQVASFNEKLKALQLRDSLREGGHTAFVERSVVDQNAVFRVRVGPITEKSKADKQQQLIAKSFALSGLVISYP